MILLPSTDSVRYLVFIYLVTIRAVKRGICLRKFRKLHIIILHIEKIKQVNLISCHFPLLRYG